jgi:outer membrane PBP1 activator LpoA protein
MTHEPMALRLLALQNSASINYNSQATAVGCAHSPEDQKKSAFHKLLDAADSFPTLFVENENKSVQRPPAYFLNALLFSGTGYDDHQRNFSGEEHFSSES